nr:MAG TPA: hypothetical protein [Caudoviricetes sp.]
MKIRSKSGEFFHFLYQNEFSDLIFRKKTGVFLY